MSAPTPQKTQEQPPLPAMVLGFSSDAYQSEAHHYPEALPATGVPVSPAVPATQPKKLDEKSEEAPAYPQAPRPPTGPRDFSSGICDLHQSWAIFADAWCCTYCLASGHHNLVVNEQEGMYAPVCCGLFCMDVGISAISAFLPQTICFHTCFMRHLIRQRYHLHSANVDHTAEELEHRDGGVKFNAEFFLDCMTVFFCLSCAVAQHQREILRQGEWCGGVFSDRHALEAPSTVHTV